MKFQRILATGLALVMALVLSTGLATAAGKAAPTGKVNINTATAQQLTALPGVGEKLAARIVEYRQKSGGFKSVAELMNVQGLGEKNLVRRGAAYMHLVVSGSAVVIGPVILGADVDERDAIGTVADRLARLERLLSAQPDIVGAPWTAETLRLRDGLIALDGQPAGATLPEIGAVIYGRERIERDWPGKGLRQRLRRDQLRGLALRSGGYRRLLR